MRKLTALFLALLFLAAPAHALTGRVLYIVCNKLGIAEQSTAFAVNYSIARVQEVQGWKYETCMSSDTNFVNTLYAINPDATLGGIPGSRYGRYDMAVMLNMPALGWLDTVAEDSTYGVKHFAHWIDGNSARAFPIPLFIPLSTLMIVTNKFAKAYTGCISSTALATTMGRPYRDAQGDSLYLLTTNNDEEPLVAMPDSTADAGATYPYSFVHPLFWRTTDGRDATATRYAHCWMTVGSGKHRVIWMPYAHRDAHIGLLPIIFAMFTKVQPIEMPMVAYIFGRIGTAETGADTVQYGEGFKRNVDYAVANGMKLELACYPYYMYAGKDSIGGNTNHLQAVAYAEAFPDNVRLTMSSGASWFKTTYYEMKGSAVATIYTPTVVAESSPNRIKRTQDSCAVYYPIINTSRLDGYDGKFAAYATYNKADSILMALANRGITDVYNYCDPGRSVAYPASQVYQIVGPQRTWVKDPTTIRELRIHSMGFIARYGLQELDNPNWLKTAYYDTVGTDKASYKRAQWLSMMIPRTLGLYVFIDGSEYSIRSAAAKGARAMARAKYTTGVYLPACTFSGGSKTSWTGASKEARRAAVDSTRSLFLDVMKMMNNQKKMGDYLVQTYGINGTTPFIFSYLSDVKWDRRNGRAFANSHVRME